MIGRHLTELIRENEKKSRCRKKSIQRAQKNRYLKSCELYEYDILISCSIDIYYIQIGAYSRVVQNQ